MLIETDDFCCWHINTIQTTNPPKTKRGSISHATSASAQNRHGSIHKTDLISIIVRPQLIANRVKHDLNSVHCSFVIWNLWIVSRAEKSLFGVGVGVCVGVGGGWWGGGAGAGSIQREVTGPSQLFVLEGKPTKAHADHRNE